MAFCDASTTHAYRVPIGQQVGRCDDEDPTNELAPDERFEHRDHLQRLAEARVVGEEPAAAVHRLEEPPDSLDLMWLEGLQERAGKPGSREQAGHGAKGNRPRPRFPSAAT